ncbi:MAG: hypothetical protein COB81_03775 [Flavobacteriaceae bacterium]|nr:MAG: hypothetical protein COB81_03775 [Flavobacteriaceae bacterium]
MVRKIRKIGFYYLTLEEGDLSVLDSLNLVLDYIDGLPNTDRKRVVSGPKFGLLHSIRSFNRKTRHQLIFKSAIRNFRPPLLDSLTVSERDSPKRIEEGELQKTHFVTKVVGGDVIIILEKFLGCISIKQAIKYLNHFARLLDLDDRIKFGFETIAKDNFLEEINGMARVTCADVYVDKQLLAGDVLDYSERISSVKHEIVISVKAKNRDSISEFAQDVFAQFNGGENRVRRLRIVGRNSDNNVVKINSDFIEKQEYVSPIINEDTGEVLSDEMLDEIEVVFANYN